MATHNETGKKGEELARTWLEQKGYTILHYNWRYSHWEIDIIASRNNILHFFEVKTRRSLKYGFPEESVSNKKLKSIMKGAEVFLYQNQQWTRVQYNILSVLWIPNKEPSFYLIEDVYLF